MGVERRGPGLPIQAITSNSKLKLSSVSPITTNIVNISDRKPVCTWNNKWFGHQEAYKTSASIKTADFRSAVHIVYVTPLPYCFCLR